MVKASLARRLGKSPGGGGRNIGGGGGRNTGGDAIMGDARLKIMKSQRGPNVDAREMLGNKNKNMDAREKLLKMRNLKEGKLEVKKIGGVTITKKLNGKIELSTKKNRAANNQDPKKEISTKKIQMGNFTKTVLSSGKVSLSTKKETGDGLRSRSNGGNDRNGEREPQVAGGIRPERGRIGMTEYERMDEELMRSSVDKAEYDRIRRKPATTGRQTVPMARGRSPPQTNRARSPMGRSRSPMGRTRSPMGRTSATIGRTSAPMGRTSAPMGRTSAPMGRARSPQGRNRSPIERARSPLMRSRSPMNGRSRSPQNSRSRSNGDEWRRRAASPLTVGRRIDYDTPREDGGLEEDLLRRRVASKTADYDDNYTMASRREQVNTVSPLQGSKIVLSNLQQHSVTYDDIVELFGDVGALRKVRVATPGQAEVTFVNHDDAERAVEIYHNRQLDGKPMKCTLTTTSSAAMKNTFKLPASLQGNKSGNTPSPDLNLIHKALFLKKPVTGNKQTFTITMPKKGKDEPNFYE